VNGGEDQAVINYFLRSLDSTLEFTIPSQKSGITNTNLEQYWKNNGRV